MRRTNTKQITQIGMYLIKIALYCSITNSLCIACVCVCMSTVLTQHKIFIKLSSLSSYAKKKYINMLQPEGTNNLSIMNQSKIQSTFRLSFGHLRNQPNQMSLIITIILRLPIRETFLINS